MEPDSERWKDYDTRLSVLRREIEKLSAADLQTAGNIATLTPTVYHYTDVATVLAIIESGRFWFTERAHLNDTLELQYGLRIGHEMFDTAAKAAGPIVPQSAADHLMGEMTLGLVEYGYWVVSFSYEADDLSQWRSYADEGSGVCLGFSVQNLDMQNFASHIPAIFNFMRLPVQYDEAQFRKNVRPYIDLAIQLLRSVNLPSIPSYSQRYGAALLYERDLLQTMMSGLYLHAMMHKHQAYKHEQEYRLILNAYRPKVETAPQHKVRARNKEIVSYLDLPIPNWKSNGVLTHVKVGPTAAPKLEEQLATAFKSLGLPLPQLSRSNLPFRKTR